MATDCCNLVGSLNLGFNGCIISVSSNCSTEILNPCGPENLLEGASIQTVTIAGYASDLIHTGCPASAGVNIPWIRKYDCIKNITHFIFAGEGEAHVAGDLGGIARLKFSVDSKCKALSAASSSGPASIYMYTDQTNGYGLEYIGDPIPFSTNKSGTIMNLGSFLGNNFYLQSFSYEAQPGQLPVANYTLVKSI